VFSDLVEFSAQKRKDQRHAISARLLEELPRLVFENRCNGHELSVSTSAGLLKEFSPTRGSSLGVGPIERHADEPTTNARIELLGGHDAR
jgi:hypothetical protein